MALIGPRDEDDTKKTSLQKAQENGFGQKGVAGRPKRDATDLFNQRIESGKMDELVDLVFEGWEVGLRSENEKLKVTTSEKFTKAFYNPDQKIVVEGPDRNEIHMNILMGQDNLSKKEKEALMKFQNFLQKGVEDEDTKIIDAEVIEYDGEESESE